MGSARRRKLEAALEKATIDLGSTRAERDLLASTLHDLREHGVALDPVEEGRASPPPSVDRLAARVSELRDLLTVLAPQTEEEQRHAREAVEKIRRASERTQALEHQLAAARQHEDRLSEHVVHDRAAIADLEARIAEFEGIEARIARFDHERGAVEENAAEVEHLRMRIEDLQTHLESEAERAEELGVELGAAQARIREMETDSEATELRIAELTEAQDLAETQRETALEALEDRLNDLERLRAHVAQARTSSETAERERDELASALEQAESERDAARAALEARVGDVHRLRDKVAELEGRPEGSPDGEPVERDALEGPDPLDGSPRDAALAPAPADSALPQDSIELRIARVQERLEQTELRVRRALTTAEVAGPARSLDPDPGDIIDITGRDAQRELDKLRDEVTVLAERATDEEEARQRAEHELAALRGRETSTPAGPVGESPPPGSG